MIADLMKQPVIEQADNEYLELIIKEIYSKDNIEVKTRVNQQQVIAITKAIAFADFFNVPVLKQTANKLMELLISLDGKGREEFTRIASNMGQAANDETPNLFEKLVNK